jgi:hypothetical protein
MSERIPIESYDVARLVHSYQQKCREAAAVQRMGGRIGRAKQWECAAQQMTFLLQELLDARGNK